MPKTPCTLCDGFEDVPSLACPCWCHPELPDGWWKVGQSGEADVEIRRLP